MKKASVRRRKGVALLATMLFLLVATSFHSAADNDFARVAPESRVALPSALPAADDCPACVLDGILSVRPSLAPPVGSLPVAERVTPPVPESPFVAPRASVDSRPPPPAA